MPSLTLRKGSFSVQKTGSTTYTLATLGPINWAEFTEVQVPTFQKSNKRSRFVDLDEDLDDDELEIAA